MIDGGGIEIQIIFQRPHRCFQNLLILFNDVVAESANHDLQILLKSNP